MTNFFLLYSFIFSFGSLHAMSQVFDESLPVAMNNMTLDENNDLNRFASEGYDRVQILYNGKKKGYCPSDHEINQKHMSKMDDLLNAAPSTPSRKKRSVSDLHTPDIKLINSLSDRNAKTLEIKLKSMKYTPEKSKERIINSLAHKNRSSIIGDEANEVYQNDLLLQGYTTKSHVNNLISRNINELLSPEKVSAVAYHHIMHPVEKYDANGQLIGVSGGHDMQQYVARNLFNTSDDVFIAENNIVSVNLQGKVPKTLNSQLSPEIIVSNRKKAKTVAQNTNHFKISELPVGGFMGSYHSLDNPLVHSTQFPVVAITDKNQGDMINVGKFGKFSSDGSVIENPDEEPLQLSRSEFDTVMKKSSANPKFVIPATSKGTEVYDITEALEEHFSPNLSSASGKKTFPTRIYGIKEAR